MRHFFFGIHVSEMRKLRYQLFVGEAEMSSIIILVVPEFVTW